MDTNIMDLVDRARRGEDHAMSCIMQELVPDLHAYVRVHAGERIRARESGGDLVQSICREVLEDLGDFDGQNIAQFKKWLFTVALNKVREKHRYHDAQCRDLGRESDQDSGVPLSQIQGVLHSYSRLMTPSRIVHAKQEVERVERALDQLPDNYKEIISMCCIMGLTQREVAQETGREEAAVRKLLSRARAKLSFILAQPE